MPEISLLTIALLLLAAFAAGWLDAVGGGGGLIQLPVLLLTLPANATVAALGTNKLASSFGTGSAAVTYARRFPPNYKRLGIAMLFAFVASAAGAAIAGVVSVEIFQPVIWLALLLVWLINWFNPAFKSVVSHKQQYFLLPLAAAGVGFYDGLIGPGTGAFLLTILVYSFGMDFLSASANAKFINLSTNLAAIAIFGLSGNIYWLLGGMMAIFNIAGAQLGARFAIKRGGDFVRRVLLSVVAVLLVRFALQIWG